MKLKTGADGRRDCYKPDILGRRPEKRRSHLMGHEVEFVKVSLNYVINGNHEVGYFTAFNGHICL